MSEKENLVSHKINTVELMKYLFQVLNFIVVLFPRYFKVTFYALMFLLDQTGVFFTS